MKKILFGITIVLFISACSSEQKVDDKYLKLIGQQYSNRIYNELGGDVDTLPGTNIKKWIAYFPKTDITIIEDKKTRTIIKVIKGKKD